MKSHLTNCPADGYDDAECRCGATSQRTEAEYRASHHTVRRSVEARDGVSLLCSCGLCIETATKEAALNLFEWHASGRLRLAV